MEEKITEVYIKLEGNTQNIEKMLKAVEEIEALGDISVELSFKRIKKKDD